MFPKADSFLYKHMPKDLALQYSLFSIGSWSLLRRSEKPIEQSKAAHFTNFIRLFVDSCMW